MRKILLLTILVWCLAGCGDDQPVAEEVPVLPASMIDNAQKVHEYINKHANQHESLAKSYYRKSKLLIIADPEKAIWNIKRAITLHPKLEYYQDVIRLLMARRRYKEAARLLHLLSNTFYLKYLQSDNKEAYLFTKPDFETYYDFIISEYMAYGYIDPYYIENAEEIGIDKQRIKKTLLDDERFTVKEGTETYDKLMLCFLSTEEIETYCRSQVNFEKFMNHIPDLPETFDINQTRLPEFNYKHFYGDEFEEGPSLVYVTSHFLNERQVNPNTWLVYNTIGKRKLNNGLWFLLYSVDTSQLGCPLEMRHIYYTLASYKPTGEIIATKQIAWQTDVSSATANITQNSVVVTEYKRAWKKAYHKADFDNELLFMNKFKDDEFTIQDDGQIVKVSPSAD
ncbi:MAG: hypothetical protein EAY81_10215 [Bacteroidetes bacterium]|nr:MAG: hypothetical protein EAY81_10215 [Bacteroidota bacterium]